MEFKRIELGLTEVKFGDETSRTFEGYASVFGGVDSYGDMIMPGAYKATLENRERPIRMRWNHYGPVIGKWTEVYEDDKGLYVKGSLTPGHSVASDVYASMMHRAVDGMSIGYRVVKSSESGVIRKLEQIDLIEISVVEEPADLGAQATNVKNLNSLISQCESYKELESLLREAAGLSRSNATCMVSRIKAISLGEQERKQSSKYDEVLKLLTKGKSHD
jgi:HK97 family phage prohead protease